MSQAQNDNSYLEEKQTFLLPAAAAVVVVVVLAALFVAFVEQVEKVTEELLEVAVVASTVGC